MATLLPDLVSLRAPSTGPESSRTTSRRGFGSEDGESILSEVSFASTSASLKIRPRPRVAKGSFTTIASRDLREFSRARRLIPPEIVDTEPKPSLEDLERDLGGSNGRWKQKKAVTLIAEQRRMKLAADMAKKLAEEQKRQMQQEQRDWLRRAKEEEDKALLAEAKRHEAKERALKVAFSWQNFAKAVMQEEEHLMRRLREPVQCITCDGSGACACCGGTGSLPVSYLSASVTTERVFHGQNWYGCDACGGMRDGVEEEGKPPIHTGTGRCADCAGHGKIWPHLGEVLAKREEVRRQEEHRRSAMLSETSDNGF